MTELIAGQIFLTAGILLVVQWMVYMVRFKDVPSGANLCTEELVYHFIIAVCVGAMVVSALLWVWL